MFEPGAFVHYASSGLCRVEEVTELEISGASKGRLYYRLTPVGGHSSGTIYTPVDNQKVAMRRALTRDEAEQLIDEISEIGRMPIADEKKREVSYREALNSPECRDWVGLIKTLHGRREERLEAGKKVTATEERYYQEARNRLHTEIAQAIGLEMNEVEDYVSDRIERSREKA